MQEIKCVVVGDHGVGMKRQRFLYLSDFDRIFFLGKTSLINRFTRDEYPFEYTAVVRMTFLSLCMC